VSTNSGISKYRCKFANTRKYRCKFAVSVHLPFQHTRLFRKGRDAGQWLRDGRGAPGTPALRRERGEPHRPVSYEGRRPPRGQGRVRNSGPRWGVISTLPSFINILLYILPAAPRRRVRVWRRRTRRAQGTPRARWATSERGTAPGERSAMAARPKAPTWRERRPVGDDVREHGDVASGAHESTRVTLRTM
jgi:hypothetical protein